MDPEGLRPKRRRLRASMDRHVIFIDMRPKHPRLRGDQIRAIRMETYLTQQEFADCLGVNIRTVQMWEGGWYFCRASASLSRLVLKTFFKHLKKAGVKLSRDAA